MILKIAVPCILIICMTVAYAHEKTYSSADRDQSTPKSKTKHVIPPPKYILKGGTAYDPKTKLTWMRCSLGQTWNGTTCTGKAREYYWEDANKAIAHMNHAGGFSGFTNWKLPNILQLSSLRYCSRGFKNKTEVYEDDFVKISERCKGTIFQRPTINQTVFPQTVNDSYWSASGNGDCCYLSHVVHFGDGSVNELNEGIRLYVRAVRVGQ